MILIYGMLLRWMIYTILVQVMKATKENYGEQMELQMAPIE